MIESEEKQELLKMSEISLWLDTYDDIFSDFDSRHYSERALSQDFLNEIKRASRDKKSGQIEIRFLIHKEMRNLNHENFIRRRLKSHFKHHYEELRKDMNAVRKRGIVFTIIGALMITVSTYLAWLRLDNFLATSADTLMAAGGWFTGWTGLDQIYYGSKEISPDMDFYEKMSNAQIIFLSY
jgi:hypothetical protein